MKCLALKPMTYCRKDRMPIPRGFRGGSNIEAQQKMGNASIAVEPCFTDW